MPDAQRLIAGLEAALDARIPALENYDSYYLGEHRIQFATSKWRGTFADLFCELSDNWSQLVVDAAVERLQVIGFRFGPVEDGADPEAGDLWQANYLAADSALVHTEACKSGIAYLLVTPGDDPETPRITVEHPAQMIALMDPADRRKRLGAFKRWGDEDATLGMLYTEEAFYPIRKAEETSDREAAWRSNRPPIPTPLGIVPVVPMLNTPDILGRGVSDLNVVIPLQDAVNKLLADLLVNSEYVAFPQRYATGLEIPTDPATGRPLDREQFL